MKRLRFALLLTGLLALCCLCCVPFVTVASGGQHDPGYNWIDVPGNPYETALFLNGQQLGNYGTRRDAYLPLVNGQWGAPCAPPVALPEKLQTAHMHKTLNFGVDLGKLQGGAGDAPADDGRAKPRRPRKPRYKLNDKEIDRDTAKKLLKGSTALPEASEGQGSAEAQAEGKEVPDDAHKQRLTMFLPSDQLEQARADLAKLGEQVGKLAVQLYPSDSWVKRYGFTEGTYIQNPNGKALSHTPGNPGPEETGEALARAEKLYDPDPNYQEEKVPDLTKPQGPLPGVPLAPVDLAAGAASLLTLLGAAFMRRG